MLCFIYQYSRYTDERSDREKGSRAQALVKFKKASQVEDGTRWLIPKVDVRNCVGFVLTPCKYI